MTKINNFNECDDQELVPGVNDMNEEQELVPGIENQEIEESDEEEESDAEEKRPKEYDAADYFDYLEQEMERKMDSEMEQELERMKMSGENEEEEEYKPLPIPPVKCSKNHHTSIEELEESGIYSAPSLLICFYGCDCDIDCSCKEFYASLKNKNN